MLQKLRALLTAPATSDEAIERRLQLAAAALLIEIGKADYQRDPREQAAILHAVGTAFALTPAALAELMEDAETTSHQATSLYEFTNLVNQHYSEAEKQQLIRQLWRVAGADGNIDKYEDHLIRRIAELIYVSHSQFIRAKLEVLGGVG
jgi:uncharacterized tellurite resistance protein B-like protein